MADVLDSFDARQKYTHFRILVIGRANAGKTTLLKRVCNTTEDPRIYDGAKNLLEPTSARGIHDINRPFAFESNPQFIFHDSPGFEAGDKSQLKKVQAFIEKRATSTEPNDQLHAIWFCFAPDLSRPLLELEERFFNEQRAGNVPVIAIFTKFDDLITQVFKRHLTKDQNRQAALRVLKDRFEQPLSRYNFPPRAYLCLENMREDDGKHQDQVKELTEKTADSLDGLALKMLFVSIQQNNLELCIGYAVKYEFQNWKTMDDLVKGCLLWFRHCYYNDYEYGKTEQGGGGEREEEVLGGVREELLVVGGGEELGLLRFCQHMHQVAKFMSTEFNKPSLTVFAAILICLENSFWNQSNTVTFIDSFQEAFKLYIQTGVREKAETSLKLLEDYPPQYSSTSEPFQSALLKTLLKHRLSHSENADTQNTH